MGMVEKRIDWGWLKKDGLGVFESGFDCCMVERGLKKGDGKKRMDWVWLKSG